MGLYEGGIRVWMSAPFGHFGEHQGFDADRRTLRLTWRDPQFSAESSYYVRATQFDGDMAWSSPVWIRPA